MQGHFVKHCVFFFSHHVTKIHHQKKNIGLDVANLVIFIPKNGQKFFNKNHKIGGGGGGGGACLFFFFFPFLILKKGEKGGAFPPPPPPPPPIVFQKYKKTWKIHHNSQQIMYPNKNQRNANFNKI